VDELKIRSQVSLVFQDAEDLDTNMQLLKFKDATKLRQRIAVELRRHPKMSKANLLGSYQHLQHPAIMDCCKNW